MQNSRDGGIGGLMAGTYPALKTTALWCIQHGVEIPADVLDFLGKDVKAIQDYDNALTRIMSIYLNDLRTQTLDNIGNFGIAFANAIEFGLNEAWRLGLRENDAEQTDEWQAIVDGIIADERTHIPDFAAYLTVVANNSESMGQAITTAQNRLSLWVNRYEDVMNQAIVISAEEKTKLEWVYGDTEHCETCAQLNGIVAYAREWDESGVRPQNPPNGMLTCGGWKCQCQLIPTTKRKSPNALDRILSIGLG
jgi:hypothetical protein